MDKEVGSAWSEAWAVEICYALHVIHHTLHITYHTSHITHHTSHITHLTPPFTHHTSHTTHHTPHITHLTSHTTHHTPHITHHTSHITPHLPRCLAMCLNQIDDELQRRCFHKAACCLLTHCRRAPLILQPQTSTNAHCRGVVQALEGGDSVNLSSLLNKLALLHEKLGRLGDAEGIYMDALRTFVDD